MNKREKMLSKSNEIQTQIMFDEDSNIFPRQNPANQPSMSPLSCCPRKNLRGMPRQWEKNTAKQEDDSKCHPCHQVCPDVFKDITPTKKAKIRIRIIIKTLKMLESNYLPLIHTADGRNLALVNSVCQFQEFFFIPGAGFLHSFVAGSASSQHEYLYQPRHASSKKTAAIWIIYIHDIFIYDYIFICIQISESQMHCELDRKFECIEV